MSLISKKPATPGQRYHVHNRQAPARKRPEKSLTESLKKSGGRNCYGRITSRRRGGGHKRLYRRVDFRREKFNEPAVVEAIEYDPNRSALLALIRYDGGEKRYILAPDGLKEGDTVASAREKIGLKTGNNMPLAFMPPSTRVHAIQLHPERKAQLARSAGTAAQLVNFDGDRAILKMPSGELRMVLARCRATIGEVGNSEHRNRRTGKAGRSRWQGRRPRVRGMVMNPVDHPNGGGEGRSKSGGGRQHPCSPWGQLAKGYPTRSKSNPSDKHILIRRNGRKVKK